MKQVLRHVSLAEWAQTSPFTMIRADLFSFSNRSQQDKWVDHSHMERKPHILFSTRSKHLPTPGCLPSTSASVSMNPDPLFLSKVSFFTVSGSHTHFAAQDYSCSLPFSCIVNIPLLWKHPHGHALSTSFKLHVSLQLTHFSTFLQLQKWVAMSMSLP